jgi:flagellar hook-length control protein FliK
MAPGANTTGGQPAGKDLGPRTSRMPAPVDATAAAGAATATTSAATASPAGRAVPGAANEVVPAGAEAKSTSPDVLPTAAAWLQGQGNARAAAGESQQAANQVPAAMAPGAKATGGQPVGKDLGPRTSRMPAPADATSAAGAATATAGAATATTGAATASPAARTVPGAANEVIPAGAEAKPTSPNVLPTAVAGETAQTEPASQARGHRATTQSLSGMALQGIVSAVGEKSSAEVDPNLQAQAKLLDRPEQTAKSRSASLLEAARPVEAHATGATSILAGSQHIDGAAQAAPHGTQGAGEQRIAEASRPADQIIENVRQAIAHGQREVTINLNPPELGRVRLRMYSEGNEIHGRLEVDNPRTLTEIRHQAELLIQRLAEDGIAIRRFEVHQMSNNSGQTGSFSPQHQDATGQMPWSHARHMPAEQQRDRESADGAGAAGARTAALAGESFSAGGLNVWM